jgi:hypothetical protein
VHVGALAELETGDAAIDVDAFIGDPAEPVIGHSEHMRLLVCGWRDYGTARSVRLGGVSGKVVAAARCAAIGVPRGREPSLEAVIGERAASAQSMRASCRTAGAGRSPASLARHPTCGRQKPRLRAW